MMHAIILAGGLGTRLRTMVPDLPKPMAPIHNKPFLAHLLDYLEAQGIRRVTFSVHYMHEKIQAYFQTQYNHILIDYVVEEELLGTGGAIAYALAAIKPQQPVFVLNGDTFVKLDYRAMFAAGYGHTLVMALRSMADCSRYGGVVVEEETIVGFQEKGVVGPGLINAGVYLLDPALFSGYLLPKQFSFEQDFLMPHLALLKPRAFLANHYFIDIGIPADYAQAIADLK